MDIQRVKPKRGEVWWVNFNPARGTEIQKNRPAVVLSIDLSNKYLRRQQVIPFTSNVSKVYSGECLVVVQSQECKAMTDQIRTVDVDRFGKRIQKLDAEDLRMVERIVKTQLGLD